MKSIRANNVWTLAILVFANVFFLRPATASERGSNMIHCEIRDRGVEADLVVSNLRETLLTVKNADTGTVHHCQLEMVDFRDVSQGKVPYYGFTFFREQTCSPLLAEPLLSRLNHKIKLAVNVLNPPTPKASVFLMTLEQAYACNLKKINVKDIQVMSRRIQAEGGLKWKKRVPAEAKPKSAK
jgi:hypothetical protein